LGGISNYSHSSLTSTNKPKTISPPLISSSKAASSTVKYAIKPSPIQNKKEDNWELTKIEAYMTPNKEKTMKFTFLEKQQKVKPQLQKMSPKPQSKANLLSKTKDIRFNNTLKSFGVSNKAGRTYDRTTKINQDIAFYFKNFLQIRNLYLFGVLDGHGNSGHILAKDIKKLVQQNMVSYEEEHKKSKGSSLFLQGKEARKNLMIKTFEKTQVEVLSSNISDAERSGSTASLVLIFGKTLLCANVGDSRVIIASENKDKEWVATVLSKDHKPDAMDESARIKAAGGKVDQYRGRG
jgi:hypothetical protein